MSHAGLTLLGEFAIRPVKLGAVDKSWYRHYGLLVVIESEYIMPILMNQPFL